jgi:hypothetical protein
VVGSERADGQALMRALVELRRVEGDRERAQRAVGDARRERGDQRGIESTTEVGAHGNVGSQPESRGIGEQSQQRLTLDILGARAVRLRRERRLPVPGHRDVTVAPGQRVSRRKLAHVFERRARRQRRPERADVVEALRIELSRELRLREEGFDFRRKQQSLAAGRVEERTDADSIAREKQCTGTAIPDAERPLSVESGDGGRAFFFVKMEDDFGVRLGLKPVTFALEIRAKLDVVEDLSVERDPQRAVFVRHRLAAAGHVDDAQPRVRKSGGRIRVQAAVIRTAMAERGNHAPKAVRVDAMSVCRGDSCNPAHMG